MSQHDRYLDPFYNPNFIFVDGAYEYVPLPKKKIAYNFVHPVYNKRTWRSHPVRRFSRTHGLYYSNLPFRASPPPVRPHILRAQQRQARIQRAKQQQMAYQGFSIYNSQHPFNRRQVGRQQYSPAQARHIQNAVSNRSRSRVMFHKGPVKSAFSTDWPYQAAQSKLSQAVRDRIAFNKARAQQRLQNTRIQKNFNSNNNNEEMPVLNFLMSRI